MEYEEVLIRKRKGKRAREYYVLSKTETGGIMYNDWYTVDEIIGFPECPLIKRSQFLSRVKRLANKKNKFRTLWEVITSPLDTSRKTNEGRKRPSVPKPTDCSFFNLFMKLPVGSLSGRII